MRSYRYRVVDVFTEIPFAGNPLAVFLDAAGLSAGDMQGIARELNLAETSFVFEPDASDALATVRIFTPEREMPFAGHPTIGTAFALVAADRVPPAVDRFALRERIGLVPVALDSREPFFAWLRTPPIAFGSRFDAAACARALGLEPADALAGYEPQVVGAGNPFLFVPLVDPAAVDRAMLDARAMDRVVPLQSVTGIFVFAPQSNGAYSRMFAPHTGVPEDPATGSATGPLGAYLSANELIERRDGVRFVNEQGVRMRRRSVLHGRLACDDAGALAGVDVGGSAVAVVDATMTLPATSLA